MNTADEEDKNGGIMQKKCETCKRVLNIPDEKIPVGKPVFATCPSCRDKIRIVRELKEEKIRDDRFDFEESSSDIPDFPGGSNEQIEDKNIDQDDFFMNGFHEQNDDVDDRDPFDFIEEEGKMSMVCIEDEFIRASVEKVLEYMEYTVFSPKDNQEALRELRMRGDFSIIVVDEHFCSSTISNNAVIRFFKRLQMRDRRDFFVVLISDKRRTMDRKDAFTHSVNMVINKGHISNFEELIKKGLALIDNFYKNFKDSLKRGLDFKDL